MKKRDIKIGKIYDLVYIEDEKNVGEECDFIGAARLVDVLPSSENPFIYRFDLGFGQLALFAIEHIVRARKDLV
jgi:hypothetical protein